MSIRTPAEAVAYSKKITKGYAGLCLVFVRTCYGIAAKYPSAATAWEAAEHKHRQSTAAGIPVGVPVFFSTPATKYGHVALHLGGGQFRTNYSAKGTVVTAKLGAGALDGMTMLGWTEDVNGVRVYTADESSTLKKGSSGKRVLALQQGMNRLFPAYANFAGDSKYGDYTETVMKEFQRRSGLKQTGTVDLSTLTALAKHGIKL